MWKWHKWSDFFYRYPGTTFMDHVERYQDNPEVKMTVVLGEVRSFRVDQVFTC